MQYSVSLTHEVLTVIAWIIMLLLGYREMRKYDKLYDEFDAEGEETYVFYKPRSFWYRMLVFTMLFCTFGCVGGDFLHNQVIYDMNVQSDHPIHFENVYFLLIKGLPTNYYVWRFFVWGIAAFLLFKILDEIKSDLDFSFVIFTLMLLNHFPNLRQTLGFMMMFYGYVLLFRSVEDAMPQKLVMGIILLIISTFFHSTIFVFIVLSLLLFIPGTKSLAMIIVSVIAFPFLYDMTKELSTQFIGMVSNNDMMQEGHNRSRTFVHRNSIMTAYNTFDKIAVVRESMVSEIKQYIPTAPESRICPAHTAELLGKLICKNHPIRLLSFQYIQHGIFALYDRQLHC